MVTTSTGCFSGIHLFVQKDKICVALFKMAMSLEISPPPLSLSLLTLPLHCVSCVIGVGSMAHVEEVLMPNKGQTLSQSCFLLERLHMWW